MVAKITLTIEDLEDGGINIKVDEVDSSEQYSKALTVANHMWRYLNTCIEQGIFDEL